MQENILETFFSKGYEAQVNKDLLDDINFEIPWGDLKSYVKSILEIPYIEFIQYTKRYSFKSFSSREITQCSSLESCTEKMCYILYEDENRGKTFQEIGESSLFSDVVTSENKSAKIKYGENQTKTAEQLGLAFQYYDMWYLSCLGYVYPNFPIEIQNKILARTILRNPLYADVVSHIIEDDVDLANYVSDMSISTQGRRAKSILKLLNICFLECQNNSINWHTLYYPTYISKSKSLEKKKYIFK